MPSHGDCCRRLARCPVEAAQSKARNVPDTIELVSIDVDLMHSRGWMITYTAVS